MLPDSDRPAFRVIAVPAAGGHRDRGNLAQERGQHARSARSLQPHRGGGRAGDPGDRGGGRAHPQPAPAAADRDDGRRDRRRATSRRACRRRRSRSEIGRVATALNRMLDENEAAFAQRDATENKLRQFLADASHELRTPLTSIRGYAELFRRGASQRPEDLAKAMRAIEDEAARMGMLVEDLLLVARLDDGRPLERKTGRSGRPGRGRGRLRPRRRARPQPLVRVRRAPARRLGRQGHGCDRRSTTCSQTSGSTPRAGAPAHLSLTHGRQPGRPDRRGHRAGRARDRARTDLRPLLPPRHATRPASEAAPAWVSRSSARSSPLTAARSASGRRARTARSSRSASRAARTLGELPARARSPPSHACFSVRRRRSCPQNKEDEMIHQRNPTRRNGKTASATDPKLAVAPRGVTGLQGPLEQSGPGAPSHRPPRAAHPPPAAPTAA